MKHHYSHSLLLIMSVVTVIVVMIVYAYMSQTVASSVAKSSQAQEAVAAAQVNKNREDAFMETYQSTSASWARLPSFFVPSDNVVAFIEALEALGSDTGATTTLSAIDSDNLDNAPAGTLGSIHAHVEADGTWSEAMRVLRLAEILPYKVAVSGVHLDTKGSVDKAGRKDWKLEFDIQAAMIASQHQVQSASSTGATK